MTEGDGNLFNASIHPGIVKGYIVMLDDGEIVYGGPIKGSPTTAGKLVLMHAEDFAKLQAVVARGRH